MRYKKVKLKHLVTEEFYFVYKVKQRVKYFIFILTLLPSN